MKKMSTNHFVEAIKKSEADFISNQRKIRNSFRVKRITRHIRVGEKTYNGLKTIAKDNGTTISKTADSIFSETNPQTNK